MPATYSGDPSSSPLDEVRFLVGDTDTASPYLQDAEIQYTILLVYPTEGPTSGNYLPAAYCADAIRSKLARKVDKSVGDLRISYSQAAKAFGDLAQQLRNRATLAAVPVYAGGQTLSDKLGDDIDPDRVQPAVKIDGMNNLNGLQSENNGPYSGP